MAKNLISGPIFGSFGPNLGPNFGPRNFLFKNMALPVTRYRGKLSSSTISEKTNDTILRKLSDGRTDGRTDRRTDRRTRVTSYDAVLLTSSVQYK